mmetsp:Transcript_79333/g.157157  ORF Transcript_79333/g.157157 Transcript_79333/m.157157 type:complete len:444 (-) Transcript_79333:397-1728(-)
MGYDDETYKTVCCWTEDTRIKYVPNPKSGKSKIRYAGYEKSKTVGESLKKGSFPLDLLFDYQTDLLSVVGGKVRHEPIDPSLAKTHTDKVLSKWYYRSHPQKLKALRDAETTVFANKSLSTKMTLRNKAKAMSTAEDLGVKLDDFSEGMLSEVDTARAAANEHAKHLLEQAEKQGKLITNNDMLSVLQKWKFLENAGRPNVNPAGRSWVYSDTFGLSKTRDGRFVATPCTRAYPMVMAVMNQWLQDQRPKDFAKLFPFTSISVNYAYSAKIHRDAGNCGPSMGAALGNFKGGQLRYWEDDDRTVARTEVAKLLEAPSKLVDVGKGPKLFDGRRAHAVEAFTGTRFSMVFFTAGHRHKHAPSKVVDFLKKKCRVEWPTEESMSYYLKALPKAKGYSDLGKKAPAESFKKMKLAATEKAANKKRKASAASDVASKKRRGLAAAGA